MINEDKDKLRKLFAELPDEQLPPNFNERLMLKIQKAALQKKRSMKFLSGAGLITGCGIVIAAVVFVFRISGYSFKLPDIHPYIQLFKAFDVEILKSPAFLFSLYIGTLGFLLLVADSMLRRHFRK